MSFKVLNNKNEQKIINYPDFEDVMNINFFQELGTI
jgi:hypothetical protein